MRIAAVGDIHIGMEDGERLAGAMARVDDQADVLLLAGDLTRCGDPAETKVVADVLGSLALPVVAVLGNHDYHADQVDELVAILTDAGVQVLEGTATTIAVGPSTLGIAGTKGFGGGFAGASLSEFGEPLMKEFARTTAAMALRLERDLRTLADTADHRIALLHYAPIPDTLRGERIELYPFLGSFLLGEAADRAGADLVLHGHAHMGSERGLTPGGIRVRNVAQPVLGSAYRIYELGTSANGGTNGGNGQDTSAPVHRTAVR